MDEFDQDQQIQETQFEGLQMNLTIDKNFWTNFQSYYDHDLSNEEEIGQIKKKTIFDILQDKTLSFEQRITNAYRGNYEFQYENILGIFFSRTSDYKCKSLVFLPNDLYALKKQEETEAENQRIKELQYRKIIEEQEQLKLKREKQQTLEKHKLINDFFKKFRVSQDLKFNLVKHRYYQPSFVIQNTQQQKFVYSINNLSKSMESIQEFNSSKYIKLNIEKTLFLMK